MQANQTSEDPSLRELSGMLQPAARIIERLGGVARVAAITGLHRTRVSNWRRPKTVGGTDGLIPQKHHPRLLNHARDNGIALSAEDFLADAGRGS